MNRTVFKIFTAGQHPQEEAWLDRMSQDGWQLEKVGFLYYRFRKGTPGQHSYRLEFLENLPGTPQSMEYVRFLEETGIEYVDSFFRWIYLRHPADRGPFELHSSLSGRIAHYRRIRNFIAVLLSIEVVLGMNISAHVLEGGASRSLLILPLAAVGILLYALLPVQRTLKKLEEEHRIRG